MAVSRIGGKALKSDLARDSNLTFNTSTLVIDYTNGRIGIGEASPTNTLSVTGSANVDNIKIDGNTISSTNVNGNITLDPNGSGTIDANTSQIVNVTDPTGAQHAATKAYVDAEISTGGNAATFTATANDSTNETVYPIFVDGATGTQGAETDAGLTYNPSTGLLTSTGFSGTLTGTLQTAAQANVTSLGTLTTLSIDNITINGNTISSTAGTDLLITPLGGQQIVLDGTIIIDAGVVTGATSITSTTFVGALTGNASGTALTVTQAAQTAITSLGTLTALTVDDVGINGKVITMTGSTDDTAAFTVGTNGTLTIETIDTAAAAANIQITADGTFEVDGTTITLDASSNIFLDAGGGSFWFRDDGATFMQIENDSLNAKFTVLGTDNDISFVGDDGGVIITALLLDISEDGAATFSGAITGGGLLTTGGNIVIPNDGNIGSVGDSNAIAISSSGVVTMDQIPVFSAGINVSGGTIAGTLATAAQGNVTSLGTLTALQVDNININTNTISSTAGTDLLITPLGGQQLILDGTIIIDAGVVTGATSITSAAFVGDITGDVTGNADTATESTNITAVANNSTNETVYPTFVDGATGTQGLETDTGLNYNPSTGLLTSTGFSGTLTGTLQTAAQANVTSLGTLTGLVIANDGLIGSASDTDAIQIASTGDVVFSAAVTITGNLTINGTTTTVSSTNTVLEDTLIELNTGAGSNANDMGIIMERGSTGNNAIMAWDESEDKFIMGTTTAVASATGNLSITKGTLQANIDGNVTGTLLTAAQTNITSLGTLTALQVDNININGNTISSTAGTDLLITPLAGEQIVLDSTIIIDAGVVTGATSITSAAFVGDLTGDVTGTADIATSVTVSANNSTNETVYPVFVDAATGTQGAETDTGLTYNPSTGLLTSTGFSGNLTGTLQTAAQTNITSVGTLTTLSVDNITINGNTISSTAGTDLLITPLGGQQIVLDSTIIIDAGVVTGATSITSTAFVGALTGNADTATQFTSSANDSANETVYPVFVDGQTGAQDAETDSGLTYNPSTGIITSTGYTGTLQTAAQANITSVGTLTGLVIANAGNIGSASSTSAIAISSGGVVTFSQAPVFPDGSINLADLDIDGGTDINAAIIDADLFIVDDGAGGTNRKTTALRLKTYIGAGAADDLVAGDAAVLITTTTGNITIDAQEGDTDIIFKGTDDSSDITALTLDMSEAGKAIFNGAITGGGLLTTGGNIVIPDDGNIGSATDTNAIAISSGGVVTMDQIPVFSAGINVSGGTIAGTLATAAQTNVTSLGTLTALQIDNININGNTISSTAGTDLLITPLAGEQIVLDSTIIIDAGVVTGATSITSTAFVGALTGNADTATKVTVTDSTANTNFPVTFHDESNALLDDTGALRYNPSTGTLLVPNLTVAGTTTQVDTVTMNAQNAVVFEGATANEYETTLSIVDPTGDHTQYLINQGGYIPVLAVATTTAITSTPAELNLLDTATANSVVNSKAVIYGSSGELAGTLSTVAQTNITSLGTLTALQVDNININGNTISSTAGTDLLITPLGGQQIVLDSTIIIDAGVVTGATSITSTAFVGNITGDVTGNADTATQFTSSANDSTNETVYPVFVDAQTGAQGAETDAGLTYNPSTGLLTSTGFSGTLTGTLQTAAQGNVTSLGTLTALTVDDVVINGKVITMTGSTSDTVVFTAGTNGTLSIVTTDADAAAANIQITADGTAELAGTTVTLDSSGGITLDADNGTITFADGGVSLGTITSSGYTGNVVGNVTGTLLTAAQANITSLGTLTTLSVDNITINGNTISSTAGTDLLITPLGGQQIVLDSTIIIDAGVVTGATSITSTAFVGDITGDVTGNADTATESTNITAVANNSTNETVYPTFVDGATGTQGLETDTGLTYNPSTGLLTSTGFSGNLTGTLQTAAQGNVTSLGTLTTLTVDSIIINGTNIGHTSDTDAIAIGSGGNVTFTQDVLINARNELKFHDTDSSNYVSFRAASTISSNVVWTLPSADGSADQLMKTDGAGNLSWAAASGAVTGFTNSTVTTCPGAAGNYDLAEGTAQDGDETPFEAGGQDAFGVSTGTVYDSMEPVGSTTTIDYGDSEAYVGA